MGNKTDLPPAHILAAAPGLWSQAGQAHWVTVQGQSMQPFLRDGDEVWVAPNPAGLRRGEVVVLRPAGGLLVHRLLRAEPWPHPQRLWTQGDSNRLPDPPISSDSLLGRVVATRRRGRTTIIDTTRWRATGWLIAWGLIAVNKLDAGPGWLGGPSRLAGGAGRRALRLFYAVVCR